MAGIELLSDKIKGSTNLVLVKECKQVMHQLSRHLDYSITPSFNIDIHITNLEKDKQVKDNR